jgi:two-component system, NarL family, sensor histidine kinase UhpB
VSIFSRLPLLWQVFAINAAMLLAAALLLVFTPVTVSAPIKLVEVIVVAAALLVVVSANLVLLRTAFAPLEQLVRRMPSIDLLRPGQRFPEGGGLEVSALVHAFNEMLDRLELERRESGRRALAAQEAERLRVARGLHDEVGQVLTGVLLQLDSLAAPGSAEPPIDLDEPKEAVRQALDEVRRIARELRPEMLEHLGLVSSLTELSSRFARLSGVVVEHSFAADLPQLDADVELAIYRVAQESMTNVARHADASHVRIALERGAGSVVLHVVDDGRGFVEDSERDGHGGGLRGMRERALQVGGELALGRGRDGGAEVRLEVPVRAG